MSSVPTLRRQETHTARTERVYDSSLEPNLRRLRHIRSITIANIHYVGASSDAGLAARGVAAEERQVAGSSTVDHKLATKKSAGQLNHVRSFMRLQRMNAHSTDSIDNDDDEDDDEADEDGEDEFDDPPPAPSEVSTIERHLVLGLDDQLQRQLKIQEMGKHTFFDSFYSLNRFMNLDDPVYISRVFEGQPNVQEELDFSDFSQKSMTLNLFIRREGTWRLLCEYHIKLSLLVNVGDEPAKIWELFRNQPNFLLISLSDGCYYVMSDSITASSVEGIKKLQAEYLAAVNKRILSYNNPLTTCSYDQIMKLDNLEVCVRDLKGVRSHLSERISAVLDDQDSEQALEKCKQSVNTRLEYLRELVEAQKYRNFQLQKKLERKRKSMASKKEVVQLNSIASHAHERVPLPVSPVGDSFDGMRDELAEYVIKLDELTAQLNTEKSRVAKDLLYIFPIEPTSSRTSDTKYSFQLFGYQFPTSASTTQLVKILNQMTRTQMHQLNALMGYLTLVMLRLSKYLCIPLRYPIRFLGSNSYIHDPISHMYTQSKNRLYPLFITQNATLILRFSYGLMLMSKDMNQLFESENLYKVDDFNLLVNTKIFLTCLCSYDGRTDHINDIVAGRTLPGDYDTRESLNETLMSEDRTNHIKRHLATTQT